MFAGIFGFSGMIVYVCGIGYLVFRKNKKATHLLALATAENGELTNDVGGASMDCLPREDIVSMQLPQRRVTVDVDLYIVGILENDFSFCFAKLMLLRCAI